MVINSYPWKMLLLTSVRQALWSGHEKNFWSSGSKNQKVNLAQQVISFWQQEMLQIPFIMGWKCKYICLKTIGEGLKYF